MRRLASVMMGPGVSHLRTPTKFPRAEREVLRTLYFVVFES